MATTILTKAVFTTEEITNLNQAFQTIENITGSKVQNLSNTDRRILGSVAEQNKLFINRVNDFMEQYPELTPDYISREEFAKTYQTRHLLEEFITRMEIITRNLSDTKILLDHENYQTSLTYYRNMKFNAQEKLKSAPTIYGELKQFFLRKRKKENEEESSN